MSDWFHHDHSDSPGTEDTTPQTSMPGEENNAGDKEASGNQTAPESGSSWQTSSGWGTSGTDASSA